MDNSDISFQCIDADEAIEDNADEESDQVTVNKFPVCVAGTSNVTGI